MELGAKWLGEDALHHGGVCAEIDEQPPFDDAFDDWNAHGQSCLTLGGARPTPSELQPEPAPGVACSSLFGHRHLFQAL
jgi:hypothetical protein